MNRKMGYKEEEGQETKFSSGMEKGVPKQVDHRSSAVNKAREALSMRKRSNSGARLVMRDGPTTPMVQSSTNPLTKNRPPSGNRKTSKVENADLANELGINPWD